MAKPNETTKNQQGRLRPIWVFALAVFLFTASAPFWATDEAGTRKALEEQGLKPVTVGGYDSLGCLTALYATRFTAKDKDGKNVSGTACATPGIAGVAGVALQFDKR